VKSTFLSHVHPGERERHTEELRMRKIKFFEDAVI